MTRSFSQSVLVLLSLSQLASCLPRPVDGGTSVRGRSRVSSITMPVPDKIKSLIGADKINSYSLKVEPGICDAGINGTRIDKASGKLELGGGILANEKLRQGCAYTLILSLGKSDATGTKLEKIYLTNDVESLRTQITIEKSRASKIQVTALLRVTDDGKRDLNINEQAIPVPSQTESDAEIGIDVANQGLPQSDYNWRGDAVFSDVATYAFSGNDYGSVFYRDVMSRTSPGERYMGHGPSTQAHETLHGLVNEMRNRTSANDGFFYLESGKGLYVKEPKENLRDVKNHIGASFKQLGASRYQLYLVKQPANWPNTLYIFDEWNAYIGTTRSAVEMKKAGRWDPSGNADPVEGLVDFMYFCSASLKSIKNVDPEYLANNKQFKAAFAMLMEESVKWMNEAKNESIWANSEAWVKMRNLQTADDAAQVRAAVKELMGSAWTMRVLGF